MSAELAIEGGPKVRNRPFPPWPVLGDEDVQAVAVPVLGHRLIVRPEAEVEGKRVADIIRQLLGTVPVLATA